jgi:hypothetical protein
VLLTFERAHARDTCKDLYHVSPTIFRSFWVHAATGRQYKGRLVVLPRLQHGYFLHQSVLDSLTDCRIADSSVQTAWKGSVQEQGVVDCVSLRSLCSLLVIRCRAGFFSIA